MEYAQKVLKVHLTPDQAKILRHLLIPPCIVNVPSANNVGKSYLAAVAISWWFDAFRPGHVYSTSPKLEQVKNVLWAQLRILRGAAGLDSDFIGPKAPEMYDGPDHLAVGLTAARGESFKGRHIGRKLFIFDEATGLPSIYFDELPTMFDPEAGDAALFIYNPTDTTSRMFVEDQKGMLGEEGDDPDRKPWWRFPLSALDHPNVVHDDPKRFPGAVNRRMVTRWVREGCEPVEARERQVQDIEWPPGSGQWHRPGPWFQARALGLWPDSGEGVWSDHLFEACLRHQPSQFPLAELPRIGCDCATGKGEDYHAIHGRWGKVSLLHETSNTMDPARIFTRLKDACRTLADFCDKERPAKAHPTDPKRILILLDDDGVGCAVRSFLAREGYSVQGISAGSTARQPSRYPARRDELWFITAEKARQGLVNLARLDRAALRRLRQQLLAPRWDLDAAGRRRVEEKDLTKEKIGRSPDDADALNLAYAEPGGGVSGEAQKPARGDDRSNPLLGRR